MPEIVQQPDAVLRQVAKEVPVDGITTPKIKKILKDMGKALASQDDGVAIAAPQIGYSLRIFLVSGKVFNKEFIGNRTDRREGKTKEVLKVEKTKDRVFINPVLSKLSRDKEWMPEGCLSVRWLYGKVNRSKKAFVEAYDENGKKFKLGGADLLAQIFQHETDHLNGILFHDTAKDLREELPEVKS
jgi:peptide deformylase